MYFHYIATAGRITERVMNLQQETIRTVQFHSEYFPDLLGKKVYTLL